MSTLNRQNTFVIIIFNHESYMKATMNTLVFTGQGLIFVVFPEALGHLPGTVFWTPLFFLMMIFIALSSQVT